MPHRVPRRSSCCASMLAAAAILLVTRVAVVAQPHSPSTRLVVAQWPASWIDAAGAPERDAVVLHTRRLFELDRPVGRLIVHVSADNRFILHVNGQRVGAGPARGDLQHWAYETYDLAPLLRVGSNVIAATVWNFGTQAPMAQMSRRTGFLLQADDPAWDHLNTGRDWQVQVADGHGVNPRALDGLRGQHFYYAAAPGERRDGRRFDWDWDAATSRDDRWRAARALTRGHPTTISKGPGWMMSPEGWLLTPNPLPPMRYQAESAGAVVRSTGMAAASLPLTIPADREVTLLLDRATIVNAYPELVIDGGRDAEIRMTYAEALYGADGTKGDRRVLDGKSILGMYDEVIADGGHRRFQPLWFRTWRFLEVRVKTAAAPITIEGVSAYVTGFPLEPRATFTSSDQTLADIWNVGWRTMTLAAHETYMDAPYWEQLQYVGDTRIDALLSYAVANDDRLARRAIELFDWSRQAEGITQSRYPTSEPQYIPPYSLFFVDMVHDFWMYRGDETFVRARLPAMRAVLDWFLARVRADGLLGFLPYWVHGDTSTVLDETIQDPDGGSGVITAQLVTTLRGAAAIEAALGDDARARRYRSVADRSGQAVGRLWDPERGLMADTPARRTWGHPVNIAALAADLVPTGARATVLANVLRVAEHPAGRSRSGGKGASWPLDEIPSASFYFRFYLARAMETAGAGDRYTTLLGPWRDALALGLTTWPEHPEPTRSDCHAWSAHPNLDLLRVVAGVRPDAPAFARVRIAPAPGSLERFSARHPHPRGDIEVDYEQTSTGVAFVVRVPVETTFVWRGREQVLAPGDHRLSVAR